MKNLCFIFFLCLTLPVFSQSNIDLYKIEKEGDRLVSAGKLENAAAVYGKYKIISGNTSVASMDKKIENVNLLLELDKQANESYNAGKYIQSVDKFKQYRKLFPGISITRMDTKIEDALVRIEKQGSIASLNEKDKIIFGFEKNYLGEKAMETGDFDRAKELYKSAAASVKNIKLKNSVTEQANERLAQINKCLNIRMAVKSITEPKNKSELLESYKSSGGIIIRTFEQEIISLRLQIENGGTVVNSNSIGKELQKLASNCDLNTLTAFVGGSDASLYESNRSKDSLYSQIYNLNVDLNEIRTIKLSRDNSQRNQFVFGGYEALILSSDKIPIVGEELKTCLKKEYFSFLYSTAKPIYEQEMNLIVARDIAINAKQYATTREDEMKINDLISKINSRVGCGQIISLLTSSLNIIDTNLDNCLLTLATSNFDKMIRASEGCMTPVLEARINNTQNKIKSMQSKASRLNKLKLLIDTKLEMLECEGVEQYLTEIRTLEVCNQNELGAYVILKARQFEECSRKTRFNLDVQSATNDIKGLIINTETIEAVTSRIENARIKLEDAQKIATTSEQYQLKEAQKDMERAEDRLRVAKADRRKERLRNYDRIIKPELYIAAMTLIPRISSKQGAQIKTESSTGNYETGLNLRFLRRKSPVGSAIGIHYATNDFQILNERGILSERVKAEYLGAEYKLTTGFKKNSHPYFGLGFGAKIPIKAVYEDKILNTRVENAYFQSNDYVKTQVFSSLSLGFEGHRKNLGFSIEGFARFSGFLEDDKDKTTTFPILKQENFRFYKNNPDVYKISAISWGFALTVHLW